MSREIFNPDLVYDHDEFGVGNYATSDDGKEYVFVRAFAAIAQYDAVAISSTGTGGPTTRARAPEGTRIGVAQVAIADDEYGWVQVRGNALVHIDAMAAAANVGIKPYTDATAGEINDAANNQNRIIGMWFGVAALAAGNRPCVLSNPFIMNDA